MINLINEREWNCDATFSVIGTRKEMEEQLGIDTGSLIREVEVSCSVEDNIGERTDHFIICGDDLDSIKEKALKLFCGIYINLLVSVPHGEITVSTLIEKEETDDLDFEEDFDYFFEI